MTNITNDTSVEQHPQDSVEAFRSARKNELAEAAGIFNRTLQAQFPQDTATTTPLPEAAPAAAAPSVELVSAEQVALSEPIAQQPSKNTIATPKKPTSLKESAVSTLSPDEIRKMVDAAYRTGYSTPAPVGVPTKNTTTPEINKSQLLVEPQSDPEHTQEDYLAAIAAAPTTAELKQQLEGAQS